MKKLFLFLGFLIICLKPIGQEIYITSPVNGSMLPSNRAIIQFYSDFRVELLDIQYSMDQGNSWRTVSKSGYGLGEGNLFVDWSAPDTLLTDCIIRVMRSDNHSIGDTSEPFVLYPVEEVILKNDNLRYIFANDGGNKDGLISLASDVSPYASIVYKDGLMFGGYVNGELRLTGTNFYTSMIPGKFNRSFDDEREFKIWHYRKDWLELPDGKEKEELKYDYENWPVDLGAPFEDKDNDGKYTPYIDSPKEYGDEYAWFLMNDSHDSLANIYYKSKPLGLQVSSITYTYHNEPTLKNIFFRKYLITNKEEQINDFIVGYFSDFDLGDHRDDYVGCDTTLNLGFGYNGQDIDDVFGIPPAIGYALLYGPAIDATEADSAIFNDTWITGKKNLGLTSFAPMIRYNNEFITDGSNKTEWYNNLNGKLTKTGDYPVDPHTDTETNFALAGDPITEMGWYEGDGWPNGPYPYDRRFIINTGNITFYPGDTIDIAYAIIFVQGDDRLNSLAQLKEKTYYVNNFHKGTITKVEEKANLQRIFSLSQNYPNPFNPATKIKYTIGVVDENLRPLQTQLIIYDILGRKVKTLVNEVKSPGTYEITFDASQLASGVYLYRLTSGSFVQTKKMMVIK